MRNSELFGVIVLASTLSNAPALAVNGGTVGVAPTAGHFIGRQILVAQNGNKPTAIGGGVMSSEPNPALAAEGAARARKLIGAAIYGAGNLRLGEIDDVLIGQQGIYAVVSTNSGKKIAIPFHELGFGNARINGNEAVVMAGASEADLNRREPIDRWLHSHAIGLNKDGGHRQPAGNAIERAYERNQHGGQ